VLGTRWVGVDGNAATIESDGTSGGCVASESNWDDDVPAPSMATYCIWSSSHYIYTYTG